MRICYKSWAFATNDIFEKTALKHNMQQNKLEEVPITKRKVFPRKKWPKPLRKKFRGKLRFAPSKKDLEVQIKLTSCLKTGFNSKLAMRKNQKYFRLPRGCQAIVQSKRTFAVCFNRKIYNFWAVYLQVDTCYAVRLTQPKKQSNLWGKLLFHCFRQY